ncbi:MAG: ATP-sensitive inward rectifier potassium channel 10 [Bdellovibrionaceae bacterium]|nr:ATP-sensitive inward rectifier potassium channel 10 [Pseudobdellovibrionaceae bacterium]|tara:strand:+ start:104436 stop:105275 length:840 start_codon:yes stop_codon:yes gene_type:complete
MPQFTRSLEDLNKQLQRRDPYHRVLTLPWSAFFTISVVAFLSINGIFALLYMQDPGGIANLNSDRFLDYFFFSIESISTIGYGNWYPQTTYTHMVMSAQVFFGVMNIALATGIVFAKFSLPTNKIVFSDKLILGQHDGKLALMFRAANERNNQIVDAKVSFNLIWNETTQEGMAMSRFKTLFVKNRHTPLFSLSWLIHHEVNEDSPIFGKSLEDLKNNGAMIIATITGIDGTLSQNIYGQTTYYPNQILEGHQFVDMLSSDENGIVVHYDKISETEAIS